MSATGRRRELGAGPTAQPCGCPTLDQITEVVRTVITEANVRPNPPPLRPTLTPEFRVVVHAKSGGEYVLDAADEADARTQAAHFKHGRAEVQRRLVPPWTPAPPQAPLSAPGDGGG